MLTLSYTGLSQHIMHKPALTKTIRLGKDGRTEGRRANRTRRGPTRTRLGGGRGKGKKSRGREGERQGQRGSRVRGRDALTSGDVWDKPVSEITA